MSGQREAFAWLRLAVHAACMHLCRETRARVVADTGDRFFSHFPCSRLHPFLQTLIVLWQFADGPGFLTTFGFRQHLHFVHFAAPACGSRGMS